MDITLVVIAGIVVGFVAGLGFVAGRTTIRSSRRWCPSCGGAPERIGYVGPTYRRNAPARRF